MRRSKFGWSAATALALCLGCSAAGNTHDHDSSRSRGDAAATSDAGEPLTESPDQLTLGYPNGAREIALFHFPSAGHMITMIEPHAFATDLSAWLAQHP